MPLLTPAAARLTKAFDRRPHTLLGVFLPAGFPSVGKDVLALDAFVRHGADFLEIGVPYSECYLDGPEITEAYHRSLSQGARMHDALAAVRTIAPAAPVVAVTYWGPVLRYGVHRFARDLARAGGAGAMIPDLPVEEGTAWQAAAREEGLLTPQFTARDASNPRLAQVASAASGWLYAPAVNAPTGFQGDLDVQGLSAFTRRLRAAMPAQVPVVSGIGVSTPDLATVVAPHVDGVVIGSPVVRDLLQRSDEQGLQVACDRVASFAGAVHAVAS